MVHDDDTGLSMVNEGNVDAIVEEPPARAGAVGTIIARSVSFLFDIRGEPVIKSWELPEVAANPVRPWGNLLRHGVGTAPEPAAFSAGQRGGAGARSARRGVPPRR